MRTGSDDKDGFGVVITQSLVNSPFHCQKRDNQGDTDGQYVIRSLFSDNPDGIVPNRNMTIHDQSIVDGSLDLAHIETETSDEVLIDLTDLDTTSDINCNPTISSTVISCLQLVVLYVVIMTKESSGHFES